MKKLIVGIFLVQALIIVALGIPAGGAANATWKDEATGLIVRQDNPENTLKSYYRLLEEKSYDSAVSLFSRESAQILDGDLLEAYLEENRMDQAKLAKLFSSHVLGEYAVVGSIREVNFNGSEAQPVLALLTLKENGGKWEIIEQLNDANIEEVKEVLERALEVCDAVMRDPLDEFGDQQKASIKMQTQMSGQYIATSLEKVNAIIRTK
jgi:hypothetical protein